MNYKLEIESHNWTKESFTLFDYESSEYSKTELTVNSKGVLVLNDKNITFKEDNYSNLNNIININREAHNYSLNFNNEKFEKSKLLDDQVFMVIRHTDFKNNLGLKVHTGQCLKFGKMKFIVREIFINSRNVDNNKFYNPRNTQGEINEMNENEDLNKILTLNHYHNNPSFKTCSIKSELKVEKKDSKSNCCKICLYSDNNHNNPLVNPCKCSGSMKYIHLNCLKQWLKSKITRNFISNEIIYTFHRFQCEICKIPIPERISVKNEIYHLIDYYDNEHVQPSNYVVLEEISRENNDTRKLYYIDFKERNYINIGRANESDLKISDISVSRSHAIMRIIDNSLYLIDYYSKFGTLSLVEHDITLIPELKFSVQIGKIFLRFFTTKSFKGLINCCYQYPKKNFNDYNDFFTVNHKQNTQKILVCDDADENYFEEFVVEKKATINGKTNKNNNNKNFHQSFEGRNLLIDFIDEGDFVCIKKNEKLNHSHIIVRTCKENMIADDFKQKIYFSAIKTTQPGAPM